MRRGLCAAPLSAGLRQGSVHVRRRLRSGQHRATTLVAAKIRIYIYAWTWTASKHGREVRDLCVGPEGAADGQWPPRHGGGGWRAGGGGGPGATGPAA